MSSPRKTQLYIQCAVFAKPVIVIAQRRCITQRSQTPSSQETPMSERERIMALAADKSGAISTELADAIDSLLSRIVSLEAETLKRHQAEHTRDCAIEDIARLAAQVAALREALRDAKESIRVWHNIGMRTA